MATSSSHVLAAAYVADTSSALLVATVPSLSAQHGAAISNTSICPRTFASASTSYCASSLSDRPSSFSSRRQVSSEPVVQRPPSLSVVSTGRRTKATVSATRTKAIEDEEGATSSSAASANANEDGSTAVEGGDDEFEAKLERLRRGTGSGRGKKAEQRKARKLGTDLMDVTSSSSSSSSSSNRTTVLLPPIRLTEPKVGGLPVELGFTPYAERMNGQFALTGLAALLLVELATGGSFFKFHDVSVFFTQLYSALAFSAILVKTNREKLSIWPAKSN